MHRVCLTVAFMLVASSAASEEATERSPWRVGAPTSVTPHAWIGSATRLDEPAALLVERRSGVSLGLGADVFLSKRVAIGLAYEHRDLGAESSGILEFGTIDVTRGLNAVWTHMTSFENHALSDGVLDGCVVGSGTLQSVGVRLGVAYAFDLRRGSR